MLSVKNINSKSALFIFLATSLTFFSCKYNASKTDNDLLIGEWTAEWSISPHAYPSIDQAVLSMKGKVQFNHDGQVLISAFGYPGCIFSNDTMQNQLSWIRVADSIKLSNPDGRFNLTYNIREFNGNVIRLELMDDIMLTLAK